jgi:hypothetical protein
MKEPPSCSEILKYNAKKKDEKPQTRGTTSNKFEDTFVADLLVLNYEILV